MALLDRVEKSSRHAKAQKDAKKKAGKGDVAAFTKWSHELSGTYQQYLEEYPDEMKKALKKLDVNEYLTPKLGIPITTVAYGTAEQEEHRRAYGDDYVSYLFATPVAVSGSDYITMENYARCDGSVGNRTASSGDPPYFFCMYGTQRRSQTWHSQQVGTGNFLEAVLSVPRREALQPEDVGLPRGQRRRTGGLRREEVAAPAGMSADYYSRIEQQRGPAPSERPRRLLRPVRHAASAASVPTPARAHRGRASPELNRPAPSRGATYSRSRRTAKYETAAAVPQPKYRARQPIYARQCAFASSTAFWAASGRPSHRVGDYAAVGRPRPRRLVVVRHRWLPEADLSSVTRRIPGGNWVDPLTCRTG